MCLIEKSIDNARLQNQRRSPTLDAVYYSFCRNLDTNTKIVATYCSLSPSSLLPLSVSRSPSRLHSVCPCDRYNMVCGISILAKLGKGIFFVVALKQEKVCSKLQATLLHDWTWSNAHCWDAETQGDGEFSNWEQHLD